MCTYIYICTYDDDDDDEKSLEPIEAVVGSSFLTGVVESLLLMQQPACEGGFSHMFLLSGRSPAE